MKRGLAVAMLATYVALVVWLIAFKNISIRTPWITLRVAGGEVGEANFVPFKSIIAYSHGDVGRLTALMNLAGNTLPFIPVGLLAFLALPKMGWGLCLALAVGLGLFIEGLEALLQLGVVDIDDLILNVAGVMCGYSVGAAKRIRSARACKAALSAKPTSRHFEVEGPE